MEIRTKEDAEQVLKLFQVPGEEIYVLGSFSYHVTVYSQQVRALNLIAALSVAGRLRKNCKVAVIGGGAAGLTAAAAAEHQGARVTLLDQLSGPMGLQRNNRQRYLHPHIYDWPDPTCRTKTTDLPFLNWKAGYAADVVKKIEGEWNQIVEASRRRIKVRWDVSDVAIHTGKQPRVGWNDGAKGKGAPPAFHGDVVIMAVGFGLETDRAPWQWSYWSDDHLDGDFRRWSDLQKVLVVGCGDGGLVDSMRACLRDFRHDDIVDAITDVTGIDQLGQELKNVQLSGGSQLDISGKFEEHAYGNSPTVHARGTKRRQGVTDKLAPFKRQNREVWIAAREGLLYGPRSSILNRYIVSQLRRLRYVHAIESEVTDIQFNKRTGKYKVKFSNHPDETFHEVIERKGPRPSADLDGRFTTDLKRRAGALASFPNILRKCGPLVAEWERLIKDDYTRLPLWLPDQFLSRSKI